MATNYIGNKDFHRQNIKCYIEQDVHILVIFAVNLERSVGNLSVETKTMNFENLK